MYMYANRHRDLRLRVLRESCDHGFFWAGVDLALHLHAYRHKVSDYDPQETKWILREALQPRGTVRKKRDKDTKLPDHANMSGHILLQRIRRRGPNICPVDLSIVILWSSSSS